MKPWQRLVVYDLYERHTVTDRLLRALLPHGAEGLILDVGGRRDLLSQYTSWPVLAVNPDGTGDVVGGGRLPFADDAFAAVVTLDTLEHMPVASRSAFLGECLRVAERALVVAAPYGSTEHMVRERALNARTFEILGNYHQYLSEHVQYGLPSLDELAGYRSALPNAGTELYFAGNYIWQANAFEQTLASAHWPRPAALPFNLLQRIAASALFHPIELRTQDDGSANRFYLVFHKR